MSDATGATGEGLCDAVARIIDPHAFRERDSLYRFGLKSGDDDATARQCADRAYGPSCNKATIKAAAVIELFQSSGLLAALQQAQRVLAMFIDPSAIERTTTRNAYAQAVEAEATARTAIAAALGTPCSPPLVDEAEG